MLDAYLFNLLDIRMSDMLVQIVMLLRITNLASKSIMGEDVKAFAFT